MARPQIQRDHRAVKSRRGAGVARRRPNRIHSLQRPDTRRTRLRSAGRAVFGWGGWTKLAAMATTVAAVGALWFTSQSLHATNDQYALAQRTAVTDRYAKAVEELGNSTLEMRLGGIYLLERLASDSPDDRASIFAVLSAFVRTHAPSGPGCGGADRGSAPTADVQAVLTVIGRRDTKGTEQIDLSNTCLVKADLNGANLRGARLEHADLTQAQLEGADLVGTTMGRAVLTSADLANADLTGSKLEDASLQFATLPNAALNGADLSGVDLRLARLAEARLDGADFSNADARGTFFDMPRSVNGGAMLSLDTGDPAKAQRTSMNNQWHEADFAFVMFDAATVWPAGFVPKVDTDR
ncbi:pentapeptide repeat-containing protein [Nocardia sp. NPDC020380]|uniref:pentapeptide repeat-containing protein n=1 Tax=Nocardia sp. NPDC020380 TaxID=3364309 RepID=UPI0037B3C3AD